MVDINIHGVILGMKLALERMIPRNRGHIVNISSQAGKFGAPGGATYSATKHAVVGLTEAVRGELRLMGAPIDVSYVMPYVVNTELGSGLGQARGFANLEPSDVADAIVEALQLGIVDVWVPKSAKRTSMLGVVLPRRLSEGMSHAMKADRVLADADTLGRRSYELRAARSEPACSTAGEPQIPSTVGDGWRAGRAVTTATSPRSSSTPRPASRTAGPDGAVEQPRRRAARSSAAYARQPFGDQCADQRVPGPPAGSGSRSRSAAAPVAVDRRGEALADVRRQDRIGVGPQHQRRSTVPGQRLLHTLPAAAPGASGESRDHQRERARAGLRGGVRVRSVVGGDHLARRDPSLHAPFTRKPTGRSSVRSTKSRNASTRRSSVWRPVNSPVSRITSRSIRAACSTARRRPIGPPQSCTTTVAPLQVEILEQRRRQLGVAVVAVPVDVRRLV